MSKLTSLSEFMALVRGIPMYVVSDPTGTPTSKKSLIENILKGPEIFVAANDASNQSKKHADYVCDGTNDETQIQTAINDLPAIGGRVVLSEGTFTCAKAGSLVSPVLTYCLQIDQNDGPIIFEGQGWATSLKMADSQDADTTLLLINGTSGTYRTNPIFIRNMQIDGNQTGEVITGTHATVTVIYAYDTYLESLKLIDPRWYAVHVNLDAQRCYVNNCYVDASNGKGGVRVEVPYTTIYNNYFKGNDAAGSTTPLSLSVNSDISVAPEFVNIFSNKFDAGLKQCAMAGIRHCFVIGNQFANSLSTNGLSLSMETYAGGYDNFENVILGNIFSNIREGIRLNGPDASHTNYNNLISHNQIIEGSGVNLNFGIRETGSNPDNNLILYNIIQGATTPVTKVGANTIVYGNPGYVTENKGAASNVSDGGTIAHSCADTPTVAWVQASVAGEMASVTGLDGTNITVAIKKHDGSAGTAQTIYWKAEV